MGYEIRFLDDAEQHLAQLRASDRATVLDAIARQLTYEPTVQTKHRAMMRENAVAGYRLRIGGRLRVYYDVEDDDQLVLIKAIGLKNREKVIVGGEEIDL